jgi:CheY-like chemotaxis protein
MGNDILIIDDDEDDCELLKKTLLQIGIKVPITCAHEGAGAFQSLRESKNLPAIIVLDVNMPLMDGFQVLQKLREEFQIPVILYTTHCNDEVVKRAKSLGAVDCIQKGTSYADNLKFAKRVHDLLRKVSINPTAPGR